MAELELVLQRLRTGGFPMLARAGSDPVMGCTPPARTAMNTGSLPADLPQPSPPHHHHHHHHHHTQPTQQQTRTTPHHHHHHHRSSRHQSSPNPYGEIICVPRTVAEHGIFYTYNTSFHILCFVLYF